VLHVRVQPRAARAVIEGVVNARLKVRLTSPPVDGKANAQLCALIAETFGVARSRVVVSRGLTSRDKQVRIAGHTEIPATLASR
jgi:uncharacterized protein (TIGR00251 family)